MKHIKGMPQMNMTHHLMDYIIKPDRNDITKAKVGYIVTDPEGIKQKLMTMGMSGGFCADVIKICTKNQTE